MGVRDGKRYGDIERDPLRDRYDQYDRNVQRWKSVIMLSVASLLIAAIIGIVWSGWATP